MDKCRQKTLILCLAFALYSGYFAEAAPLIVEGQVTAPANWTGQVLIKGNVQILQGVTVQITGPAQIMLEPAANLYVQGTLVANGNMQSAPIYFMSSQEGQKWGSIYFYGAPANCMLSGCIVTGGTVGIYVLSSAPTITGCYIYGNQYGIFAGEGGAPNIQSSYLMQNTAGAVAQGSTASLNIQGCVIQQNAYGVYAAQFNQVNITGCTIKGNQLHIANSTQVEVQATGNTFDDGVPYEQYKAKLTGLVNTGQAAAVVADVPVEEPPAEEEAEPEPEEPVITFEKRSVGGAFVRGLVPGLGQFYNGRLIKGIIVPVGFVMNAGLSFYARGKSNTLYAEYEDETTTKTPADAVELYDQQDMYLQVWNIGKLVTLGWYFYGVFDLISDAMVQPVEQPRSVGVTAGLGFLGFGVGQMYNRRYLKGAFCAISELATLVAILGARGGFNENYDIYLADAELAEAGMGVLSEQEVNEYWAEAGVFEHRHDFLIAYVLPLLHLYGGLDAILDNLNDKRLAKGNAKLQLEPYFEYAYNPPTEGGEQLKMGLTLDF